MLALLVLSAAVYKVRRRKSKQRSDSLESSDEKPPASVPSASQRPLATSPQAIYPFQATAHGTSSYPAVMPAEYVELGPPMVAQQSGREKQSMPQGSVGMEVSGVPSSYYNKNQHNLSTVEGSNSDRIAVGDTEGLPSRQPRPKTGYGVRRTPAQGYTPKQGEASRPHSQGQASAQKQASRPQGQRQGVRPPTDGQTSRPGPPPQASQGEAYTYTPPSGKRSQRQVPPHPQDASGAPPSRQAPPQGRGQPQKRQ